MRTCPWCGRNNLNVYAYCQGCGRGFSDPHLDEHLPGFWTENVAAWVVPEDRDASPWPVYTAIAALLFGVLLTWHAAADVAIALPLAVSCGVAGCVLLVAWAASAMARNSDKTVRGPVGIRESTFVADTWFDRKKLRSLLTKVRGVRSVVVAAADAHSTVCVVHEDTADAARMADLIAGHAGPGVAVVSFEPRSLGEVPPARLRLGLAAASVALGGLLIGGLVAAGSTAMLSGGDSGPAGPQILPGEGVTTVVAKNLSFEQRAVRVVAGTPVTLTLDNQDTGIPHNIEFFQGTTAGEGGYLSGCTAGCADDGSEVRTEVTSGPSVHEFTFTAPAAGQYAFWCVVHPTTMRGVLYVDQ